MAPKLDDVIDCLTSQAGNRSCEEPARRFEECSIQSFGRTVVIRSRSDPSGAIVLQMVCESIAKVFSPLDPNVISGNPLSAPHIHCGKKKPCFSVKKALNVGDSVLKALNPG